MQRQIAFSTFLLVLLPCLVCANMFENAKKTRKKVLEMPGRDCNKLMPNEYPHTAQCAEGRCIKRSQVHDGKYDCCPPSVQNCQDHSDEDRDTVEDAKLDPNCKGIFIPFRCAQNHEICLDAMKQPDGRCDCCPSGNCSLCNDHSDEDACHGGWDRRVKYKASNGQMMEKTVMYASCTGVCRIGMEVSENDPDFDGMSNGVWNNSKLDCHHDCGAEPDSFGACILEIVKITETREMKWCKKLVSKNTPHHNCTASLEGVAAHFCLAPFRIRDGVKDCDDGSDEDASMFPDCASYETDFCTADTSKCFKIGEQTECRCDPSLVKNKHASCLKVSAEKRK